MNWLRVLNRIWFFWKIEGNSIFFSVIVQIKDNTFIRKKVMLVSRSTVDFRSWSLSELLAGKLSWWIRKRGIMQNWSYRSDPWTARKNPLGKQRCFLEELEIFTCCLNSACEEVNDDYPFHMNMNTSDNTLVFVIQMI